MFRLSSETESEGRSEGGTRHLFALDSFEFYDALDEENQIHRFVLERERDDDGITIYETNQATMYEFMARYLAGEYEKREYELEHSPTHAALLDALEIALARARAGERRSLSPVLTHGSAPRLQRDQETRKWAILPRRGAPQYAIQPLRPG